MSEKRATIVVPQNIKGKTMMIAGQAGCSPSEVVPAAINMLFDLLPENKSETVVLDVLIKDVMDTYRLAKNPPMVEGEEIQDE